MTTSDESITYVYLQYYRNKTVDCVLYFDNYYRMWVAAHFDSPLKSKTQLSSYVRNISLIRGCDCVRVVRKNKFIRLMNEHNAANHGLKL